MCKDLVTLELRVPSLPSIRSATAFLQQIEALVRLIQSNLQRIPLKMITPNELTQCMNLARALDLITSSRTIAGKLYVYNAGGQSKPWEDFMAEYPLERLQAMVHRL